MASPPNNHWMSPPPNYDAHSQSTSFTTLTPYLQLSHLLSLTWLAYPILSLLFIAFRLQISQDAAENAVANAKSDLLTACKAAETAATSVASMPRYLAVASNEQISDAVNGTLNAARATMVLALTIMEVIINFIVDLYRSTFLCFLELVVRGGLSIIIGAVNEFNSFLSNTFSSLRTSIQNDIGSANNVIKSAVDAINKVNPFSDISAPQISVPSLDSLQNVQLPSDFQDALTKLNDSLPTVAELKDKVNAIIDTPFELLKKDINDTFAGITFDKSTLPVPQQNSVVFCNDVDTSVVDNLGKDLVKFSKIGTVLIVVLALLLLAGNCALEWYKWRCLKQHLQYTREAWTSDPTLSYAGSKSSPTVNMSDSNLLALEASFKHPLFTKIANRMSALLRLKPSQHIHLQWFFNYVFHGPALACFLIGFFGLLSVQAQLIIIGPLEHKYQQQAVASANDFSSTIATSMNDSMYNQSAAYANDVNGRIDNVQTTINDGLFGWVNVTTTTLNSTINEFYQDIQDVVNTVFGNTILNDPVQEFIRCFIGSKVDAIESALTFLHDNLHVDVPRVNDTVLVLSPDDVNEVTKPVALAAIGSGDANDDGGLVGRLVRTYVNSLYKERIMFGIFMGLWGFVVLMGLCIIFYHSYIKSGCLWCKRRKWQKEQRAGPGGFVTPFRGGQTNAHNSNHSADTEKPAPDLPSFPPISPPRPGFLLSIRSPSLRSLDLKEKDKEPHPLSTRNPAYERSWDSFLDQAATSHADPPPARTRTRSFKISAPKKLVGLGRRGRERFVADTEKQDDLNSRTYLVENDAQASVGGSSWWQRIQGAFQRKDKAEQIEVEVAQDVEESQTPGRTRPHLTISTANRPDSHLPAVDRDEIASGQRILPNAWSVSPGATTPDSPLRHPWVSKDNFLPVGSWQPKSRRTASVPDDVHSTRDSANLESDMSFPVPLHHGFERPVPRPVRSPSPPPMRASVDFSPPPKRLRFADLPPLKPMDPFTTPFDDDHRVAMSPPTLSPSQTSSEKRHTNPFITATAI